MTLPFVSVQFHFWQNARIQSSRGQEIEIHTGALWDIQDWLGLAHSVVYILHCYTRALQRCIYTCGEKPAGLHLF